VFTQKLSYEKETVIRAEPKDDWPDRKRLPVHRRWEINVLDPGADVTGLRKIGGEIAIFRSVRRVSLSKAHCVAQICGDGCRSWIGWLTFSRL